MTKENDHSIPSRAADKSKAEGDRWASESDTVERRDRNSTGASSADQGGGITNRPLKEENDTEGR